MQLKGCKKSGKKSVNHDGQRDLPSFTLPMPDNVRVIRQLNRQQEVFVLCEALVWSNPLLHRIFAVMMLRRIERRSDNASPFQPTLSGFSCESLESFDRVEVELGGGAAVLCAGTVAVAQAKQHRFYSRRINRLWASSSPLSDNPASRRALV